MINKKGLLCGLMAAFMLLAPVSMAVSAKTESITTDKNGKIESDRFVVYAKYGIDGNCRAGASIPVNLEITNLGNDFEGLVRIIAPGNDDSGSSSVAFEKEVLLTGEESNNVSIPVIVSSSVSFLYLQIEDSHGKKYIDGKIKMSSTSTENALVGVLSDDFTALNYMDKVLVSVDNYSGSLQLVELDEKDIPVEASALEALSYMVINSYDTSKLSGEQIGAIEKWVSEGGVLVIGTGADYKQTLSAFGSDFISYSVDGMDEGSLVLDDKAYDDYLMNGSYAIDPIENTEIEYDKEDGILQLSVEDAKPLDGVLVNDNLVWNKNYANGHIIVSAMNLGLKPVNEWNSNILFTNFMLKKATTGYSSTRLCRVNYGIYTDVYNMRSGLLCLSEDKKPNYIAIIILFVLFIISMPIIYLILKKMDKRTLIWILIPVSSVVVTGAIFITNYNIRIRNPFSTSVTYFYDNNENEAGITQVVKSSVLLPGLKKYNVKLNDNVGSLNVLRDTNYDYSTNRKEYKLAIKESAEGYELRYNPKETFSTNYFSVDYLGEKSIDVKNGLQTKITKSIADLEGTVTNNTGYDIKGAMVFVYGKMIPIGEIKNGETVTIEDKETFSSIYGDAIYEAVLPGKYTDKERQEINNVLCMAYYDYASAELEGSYDQNVAFVMGYVDEWNEDYISNKNISETNRAVLIKRVGLSLEDYPNATLTRIGEYALSNACFDTNDYALYATEVEVQFDFSELSEIYALVKNDDAENTYINSSNTTVYIYNMTTGEYEELFKGSKVFSFDGCLDDYLRDNIMFLKYECSEAYSDFGPNISVVGGEE